MIEFVFDIQKAVCLIQSTTEKKDRGAEARGRIGREGRYYFQPVPGNLVQIVRYLGFQKNSYLIVISFPTNFI